LNQNVADSMIISQSMLCVVCVWGVL